MEQCLSLFSKHLRHAMHPRIFLPPSWTHSVSIPAFCSGASTASMSTDVLPFFLGLPLIARTFMTISLSSGVGFAAHSGEAQ